MSLDIGGRARWLFRNRELETDVGPIVDLGHGLTRFGENLRPNLFCSFSFFFFFFSTAEKSVRFGSEFGIFKLSGGLKGAFVRGTIIVELVVALVCG